MSLLEAGQAMFTRRGAGRSMRVVRRYGPMVSFVTGWGLFWACAVHVISFVPLWLPLLLLAAGVLSLPLTLRAGHVRAAPSDASERTAVPRTAALGR